MTDVLIRRDLLEDLRDAANDCLNHEIMRGNDRNVPAYTELVEQADAALAAPRQPEGEGLEVVGFSWLDTAHFRRKIPVHCVDEHWVALCRLSDHQRITAAMAAELERLSRMLNNVTNDGIKLADERDTLRQQLAERDATIARLEAGIPRIQEQSFQMRQQRDKLAGLLRDVRPIVALEVVRWARAAALLPVNTTVESGLLARIDAALAEVNK